MLENLRRGIAAAADGFELAGEVGRGVFGGRGGDPRPLFLREGFSRIEGLIEEMFMFRVLVDGEHVQRCVGLIGQPRGRLHDRLRSRSAVDRGDNCHESTDDTTLQVNYDPNVRRCVLRSNVLSIMLINKYP